MTFRTGRLLTVASIVVASIVVIAIAAAGCSSSGSGGGAGGNTTTGATVSIDVGTGTPVKLPKTGLKIAFVSAGLGLPTGTQQKKGVEEVAKKYGATVTTFDSQFDPTRQFGLIQNVVSSGKYNVLVTLPIVGQQQCTILTKTAPQKNILVTVMDLPLCGRDLASTTGDKLWSPGTLNTVGVTGNIDEYSAIAKACAEKSGGGTTVLLNAAQGVPSAVAMVKGFSTESRLRVVENFNTDYSSQDGAAKTAAALKTHPDLKLVMTVNSAVAYGAVRALESAGKTPGKDVFVCDGLGGGAQMLSLVQQGKVAVDNYVNDYWLAKAATQSVFDAIAGKQHARVIVPGTNGSIVTAGTETWPPLYTSSTVNKYQPTGE
jgi:ribose transport system substrate-binding protein